MTKIGYRITEEDVVFLATDFSAELDPDNEFDALSIESIMLNKRALQMISKIDGDRNALDELNRAIALAKLAVSAMHEIRFYSFVEEPVRCWLPPLTDESGSMSLSGESEEVLCMKAGKAFLDTAKEILSKYESSYLGGWGWRYFMEKKI